MTLQDFEILQKKIFDEGQTIMKSKGLSYSGKEDSLGNFRRCAKMSGSTIEQTWFTYFVKHFDALTSYLRGEYKDNEPIRGRILDMINYLFLLCGILDEQNKLYPLPEKESERR